MKTTAASCRTGLDRKFGSRVSHSCIVSLRADPARGRPPGRDGHLSFVCRISRLVCLRNAKRFFRPAIPFHEHAHAHDGHEARCSNRRNGMVLLLCAGAMVASVLIRSAGITLSAGLLAWFSVSLLVNRPTGIERLKKFRLVPVAGLLAQALWMVWIHEKRPEPEWQLGGYPQHYLAQLTIKNGNEPELGFATAGDVVRRFGGNLTVRAANVVYLEPASISPVTGLPHGSWFHWR